MGEVSMKTIGIPEDIVSALKITRGEVEKKLKLELAVALYQRGLISLGKARKLAGMKKWEFIEELGRRRIERHYTGRELKEDLSFAEGSK